jgi:NarL family two-component system response regulator LiaR
VVPDGSKPQDDARAANDTADVIALPAAVPPPAAGDILRVLVVDDHEMVRQGLASLLGESPEVVIVGQAASGREGIDMAIELRPNVVIMDVSMPQMPGHEATRQIKAHLPEVRIVALSMYDEADKIEMMCRAGADDYVLKTASANELLAAIRGRTGRVMDPTA